MIMIARGKAHKVTSPSNSVLSTKRQFDIIKNINKELHREKHGMTTTSQQIVSFCTAVTGF